MDSRDDEVPLCWICHRPLSGLSAPIGVCVDCVARSTYVEQHNDNSVGIRQPGYSFNQQVDSDASRTDTDQPPDFPDISG